MRDFFAPIYELLQDLYGQFLGYHLYGYDCEFNITNQSLYALIGSLMIMISFVICILFYYAINHPRFNRWYHWLIMLVMNAGINFYIAYDITKSELDLGKICKDFVTDPQTNAIQIDATNCMGFGFDNAIIATLFFVLFSFIVRWWSRNCSTCPIPN
jgi:hypothetical protein